jgi:ABC-2 type transport system ATP-binding protein
LPQVSAVEPSPDGLRASSGGVSAFTVQTQVGADVRELLARTVVNGGWGLLEMRPAQLSLEEIFLRLTTSDTASEVAA